MTNQKQNRERSEMSFDMNPADEDPHLECRGEIHRLTELNSQLVAACEEMLRTLTAPSRKLSDVTRSELQPWIPMIQQALQQARGET